MKIICDNCRTKYSIADEKVRGKVFKIRCKKCQNIIVVRGTQQEDSEPEQQHESDYDADAGDTPVWHMVIDREQVGPMSVSDVRDRYAKGDINEETYIWREGMGSWQRLGSTEEFVDMCQATKVAAPAAMAAPDPGAADPGFDSDDGLNQWGGQEPAQDPEPAWGGDDAASANPAWVAEPEQTAPGADPAWGAAPEQAAPAWGDEPEQPAVDQPADDPAQLAYSNLADDQERDLFATYHGDDGLLPVQPGAGNDMFGAVDAASGPQGDVVIHPGQEAAGQGMTGARNENSVLFSLSNLQDLAMGKSSEPVSVGAAPLMAGSSGDTDSSGLIDIRAMANLSAPSIASDSGFDDLPSLGSFSSPVTAAPVLMPTVEDEKPKWVLPLVIGMGFVLVGLVGLVVYLAVFKTVPTPQTRLADNSVTNPASGDDSDEPETKKTEAAKDEAKKVDDNSAKPTEETGDKTGDETTAEAKGDTKTADTAAGAKPKAKRARKGRKGRGRRGGRSTRTASRGGSSALPAAPARRAPSRGKKGPKKRDSLDDLIDGALTGGKKRKPRKKAPAATASDNLPESLTKSQIQGGMRKTKTRVQACYDRFKVPGLARVSITIGRGGRVSSAKVKGVFAGTPTGDCVKKATRSARFPKFKGSPITITYPFILR